MKSVRCISMCIAMCAISIGAPVATYDVSVARSDREFLCDQFIKDPQQLMRLAMLAKEFRLSRAANRLASEITLSTGGKASLTPLSGFPAAEALVEIGKPSVYAILSRFDGPLSERELEISTWVVHLVERDLADDLLADHELTAERLDDKPQRIRNIKRARSFLKVIREKRLRVSPFARWFSK